MPILDADSPATAALLSLVAGGHAGVLTTLKSDGRPQLSNITYHYDAATGVIGISITADRAKYRNLLRDPRASMHVTSADFWSYTVVEGDARLSPVADSVDDATVAGLVSLYRAVQGEHPDWDEYARAMVADRRVLLELPVSRVYGMAR